MTAPWQKPFRGMQVNKAHPLARGIVGCWVMNEATGDKVFDLSGSGHHGTNNGADWVADGLDFNGSSDYIETGIKINTNNNFSIIGRTKIDNKATTQSFAGSHQANRSYIGVSGSNYYFGYGDAFKIANSATAITNNTWFNYALVANNGTVTYYVDGIAVDTLSYNGVGLQSYSNLVGARRGSGGSPEEFMNGSKNHTMFFNRATSPSEIAWLHREPYAMFEQPISPASLYYEPPTGVTIPVLMHHYNQMMRA